MLLRQVFPRLSTANTPHAVRAHAKHFGGFFPRNVRIVSNESNVLLFELAGSNRLATIHRSVSGLVQSVFQKRTPSQVLGNVVVFGSVKMPNNCAGWARTVERGANKRGPAKVQVLARVFYKRHLEVPVLVPSSGHDDGFLPAQAHNPPVTSCKVSREPVNGLCFHGVSVGSLPLQTQAMEK